VPVDAILGRFGGRGRSSVAGAAGAAACSDAEFEKEEIEMVAGLLGRQAGLGGQVCTMEVGSSPRVLPAPATAAGEVGLVAAWRGAAVAGWGGGPCGCRGFVIMLC
jgi:hypothetical protein